jgi:predicted O-linked N-acetylglucosamine transferase (SPINDLY family)
MAGTEFDELIRAADAAIGRLEYERALALASRAAELAPASALARYKRAVALHGLGRGDDAEQGYRQALALDPALGKALNNIGCLQRDRGARAAAMQSFERAIAADPALAEPHGNLGRELLGEGAIDAALERFRRAVAIDPGCADAQLQLRQCLLDMGEWREAERMRGAALAADRSGVLPLRFALMIPATMRSREEILATRNALMERLAELEARRPVIADPIGSVPQCYWFFLAYHGLDDRPLVAAIGEFFRRCCPALSFVAPHCAEPARLPRRRLRIGFLSSQLREHTIGKLMMGLIARLPAARFEVLVLSPEQAPDRVTRYLDAHVAGRLVLARSLEEAQRQVAALGLDVLFYPDIGMDAFTYFLAHARLAPLQLATWGHPMSTGIPAIDGFVSHRDAETPASEAQYTERLLMLPAGDALTYYFRPDTAALDKTRRDFALPEDAHVYLCAQTLFKLHPEQDDAFRAILARDPDGLLVLLAGDMPLLRREIARRLERAMPREWERVRFLPSQSYRDFLNLIRVSDVVLDTFVFGGGNSSLEALAVGRAVVTLPSAQLRGRLTYACYRRMGVDTPIASSAEDYVAKAVRLGMDASHRREVEQAIARRVDRLFEDDGMVAHLADLIEGAAREWTVAC